MVKVHKGHEPPPEHDHEATMRGYYERQARYARNKQREVQPLRQPRQQG